MEKVKTICVMRELVAAMADLENQLRSSHDVTLNEAMALCCIGQGSPTASEISENIGLTASNTSKVLGAIEKRGLIERRIGEKDRRQMSFALTQDGQKRLEGLKNEPLVIPESLKPLFDFTSGRQEE